MRKIVKLFSSYWFSYMITYIFLLFMAYGEMEFAAAFWGSAIYALFFAAVAVLIAEFIDGLLPPEVPKTSTPEQESYISFQRESKLP